MTKAVCAVVGVGPGNGAAIAARFGAGGYRVALCARSEERLGEIAAGIEGARAFGYDVRDVEGARRAFGMRLAEGWTLAGRVVDARSGAAVPDAEVTVATGASSTTGADRPDSR